MASDTERGFELSPNPKIWSPGKAPLGQVHRSGLRPPGYEKRHRPREEGLVIFSLDPPIRFFVYSGHSKAKLQNSALFIDGSSFVSGPILISTAFGVFSMAKRFQ